MDKHKYTDDPGPWRHLASAILVRAILDVKSLNKKHMDEAIQWLHGEDAAFFMDMLLNQDPKEALLELGI